MKLNIKKIVIWLTVIMIACFITAGIILALIGNLVIALEKIDETKTIEAEGVDEISIDITSTDIDIISTDEGEITAHLYGEVSTNSKKELPALIAYKTGKELRIEIERPRVILIGINIWRAKLDVYIPKDLIETLKINTVSSDTRISDLNVNKINISNVSGDFKGEELVTENLMLNSTSGDINLKDYTGSVKIDAVSGDVVLENGSQNDNVEVVTVSGDIYMEQKDSSNITIRTISGDVEINLSENARFYVRANSVSGDIENKFPIKIISSGRTNLEGVVGGDEKEIIISATSGDISIEHR